MNPQSIDGTSEMLLLVNGALDQSGKTNESTQQFVQLAPTYESPQYVVQNTGNMIATDIESLGDLLNGQSMTFGEELSVIQRDGQQFLVLPSISVAQVLQSNEVSTVQAFNGDANISYEQPDLISVASVGDISTPMQINTDLTAVASIHPNQNIPIVDATSVHPGELTQLNDATLPMDNLPAPVPPPAATESMDMTRLVPSLFRSMTNDPHQKPQCLLCRYVANSELEMDQHMLQHRNELTEQLFNTCRDNFPKKTGKKGRRGRKKKKTCKYIRSIAPATSESKKGPFTCEICNAQIQLISAYKRHMNDHSMEKTHKCETCSETFNVESNLTLHRAIHAPSGDDGHQCPACQRTFTRIASLKSHMSVHLVDETVICTECGDEFDLQSELDSHMAEHQKDLQQHLNGLSGGISIAQGGVMVQNMVNLFTHDVEYRREKRRRIRKRASPHKCDFCYKIFQKESQLKRHVLIHTGEKPFACTECDKAFNQKGALQMHLMMHSGKKPYQCPHCPQIYAQRGNLKMHVARVHSTVDNAFQCMECSCVFKKIGSLNAHMTKYHQQDEDGQTQNQQSLLSLLTDDVMVSTNPMQDPKNNGKDDDVIQQLLRSLDDGDTSNVDSLTAPSADSLIDNDIVQQALQDSGVDPVPAKLHPSVTMDVTTRAQEKELPNLPPTSSIARSTIEAPNSTSVQDPTRVHDPIVGIAPPSVPTTTSAEKPRHFVISGLYMRSAGLSGDRMWKVRKVNGVRWHQCMYCNKEFKKPSDLVRHIRVHTQERPYKCPTCHKGFAVKTSLTQHQRTHLGYKAFKCQLCQRSFSTSGSLKVHIRRHTGARPFKCSQCDMSFRTSGHRRNHIISHMRGTAHRKPRKPRKDILPLLSTPTSQPMARPIRINDEGNVMTETAPPEADSSERSQKCPICDKQFKKSCHLKQHLRTHTGEKPYSCTQCGKSFSSFSILKTHITIHTGYKPFQCSVCHRSFTTNHTLKRHMTMHNDVRPYMCPYCQKKFKTGGTCAKHIATHRKDVTSANQAALVNAATRESPVLSDGETLEDEAMDDDSMYMKEQESLRRQQNARMSSSGVTLMNSGETVEFDNDPTLQQVDPNMIQNINKLPSFEAAASEDADANETTDQAMPRLAPLATETTPPDFNTVLPIDALTSFDVEASESLRCAGCCRQFQSQDDIARHHEREKSLPYQCPTCQHRLESAETLQDHIACHENNVLISCPYCHVYLSSKVGLQRHKEHHEELLTRICNASSTADENGKVQDEPDQTQESPPQKAALSRLPRRKRRQDFYLLSEEQSEILEQTDPTQTMTLSERILLKAVAEKDKASVVQKPGQRGRFKEFEENGPVHAHACKFCPKSFRKPSDLKRHVRIHTGDKPFRCDVCGKCFTVKSTLVCHQKSHLQKKMFRCHICDMMYAARSSLKVHMRLHTGSRPFTCSHCSATFRTSGHRKNHMMTHMINPNKPKESGMPAAMTTSAPQQAEVAKQPSVITATSAQPTLPAIQQTNVAWPDVTLTVPVESFLNTGLFQQEQDGAGIPLQLQGQNVNLGSDDPNITLQIDPLLLQQTLQDSQNVTQPAQIAPSGVNQQTWPAPNVVIQPLNNLGLQSLNQGHTGDSTAHVDDEQARPLQEINIAVPSSLAGITQQALQCPIVLSGSTNNYETNKGQELTLNLNNPALLQAVQQLLSGVQTNAVPSSINNRIQTQDGAVPGQDFTLTLSSADFTHSQGLLSIPQLSAGSDVMNSDGMAAISGRESGQEVITSQMMHVMSSTTTTDV